MQTRLLTCVLLACATSVQARDLVLAWNPSEYRAPDYIAHQYTWSAASVKMTANAQNPSYDQTKNRYELQVVIGTDPPVSSLFSPGATSGITHLKVVDGGTAQAKIRALADSSWVCDRVANADCDKGSWVTLPTQSTSDPNKNYDANKFFYEVRTALNGAEWTSTNTAPAATTLTRSLTIASGDALKVQIRALAPADFVCIRSVFPDCDKSEWVSFATLPSIDTAITYLSTPSNVSVSTPIAGTSKPVAFPNQFNIGSPSPSGTITENANVYTLTAGGGDIWGASDSFFYASPSSTTATSFTISTKIESFPVTNTGPWSKVGIQVRQGTATGAKHVSICLTPGNGLRLTFRSATNGTTAYSGITAVKEPVWIRLVRSNSTFTASYSKDKVQWTLLGSTTVSMTGGVFLGLYGARNAATSGPIEVKFSDLQGF